MDPARRRPRERAPDEVSDTATRPRPPATTRRHRLWWWLAGIPLFVLVIIVLTLAFIDEPLRRYAERQLNGRVEGYTFHIGSLDFHPIGLSLDLENVSVLQTEHPDPPVAQVTKWHASIHWRELLSGHLVSDQSIDRPIVHFTRPQAAKEAQDDVDVEERGWQDAVFAIYPLKINEFHITDGEIFYRENWKSKPLHVSDLNFNAENIRNVRSKPNEYPSPVHLDAVVFDSGRLTLEGQADFFAEPHLGINADIHLDNVDLAQVLPVTSRYHLHLTQGVASAEGHAEYAPQTQTVRLKTLTLRDVRLDFVHAREARKEKEAARKVARTAEKAANHPTLLLRIDRGDIENSEFGFVNKATNPPYRVFITGTDIHLENWSNQLSEGTAIVRLRGMFMGSGATQIDGAFRPETTSPDFDLAVRIWKTKVTSMNNLLRAHGGGIDMASGVFSVFSEMKVKNGAVDGYLKPLFKDVKAYDPSQDKDKGLLKKIYEKTVNAASKILKNTPRGEVAAKVDVSGPVENPRANTWELVVTLIENAFFDAVLPGFERQ
jgi:hypothetical protein